MGMKLYDQMLRSDKKRELRHAIAARHLRSLIGRRRYRISLRNRLNYTPRRSGIPVLGGG